MIAQAQHACYTDDWLRTNPDFVVYLPRLPRGPDGYADHFLVEHMCLSVGEFRADAHQPIWLGQPKQLCDTHGVRVGPEGLIWLAM